jgi:hypothetical protein
LEISKLEEQPSSRLRKKDSIESSRLWYFSVKLSR